MEKEQPRQYSKTLIEFAAEIGKPVEDVTPVDLLDYQHEDLPDGPWGDDYDSHDRYVLRSRPESETRRLAAIGKRIIDNSQAARAKRAE